MSLYWNLRNWAGSLLLAGLGGCLGTTKNAFASNRELIWNHDVVCVGYIIAMDSVVRYIGPSCGYPDTTRVFAVDYTLSRVEVLQGTIEDSVITVTALPSQSFSLEDLGPGSRILFWGNRLCSEGWRTWGRLAVVRPDGRLLRAWNDSAELFESSAGEPANTLADIAASAPPGGLSGMQRAVAGASAIGLARVVSKSVVDAHVVTLGLDSLGWVWNVGNRIPSTLTFSTGGSCSIRIAVSDTILVPVGASFSATHLELSGCAHALEIRHAFLPAVGVHLNFLRYAIKEQEGSLVQRTLLERE